MWIRQLGPEIANLYGPGRMIIIYTFSSITGFGLSTLMFLLPIQLPFFGGANLTVGASAPIFGLLGALVHYGRRTGSSHAAQAGLQYALIMGVMGFVIPGVDNSAHLGGFIGGFLASQVLDPLKPERVDHLAIAVALSRGHVPGDRLVGDYRTPATHLTASGRLDRRPDAWSPQPRAFVTFGVNRH